VNVAVVQLFHQRKKIRQRRRRRQAVEIGAQPFVARGLQLVPDVDFRRRILADEDDAEPRRTAGAAPEPGHRRADLVANLPRHRGAVEHASRH